MAETPQNTPDSSREILQAGKEVLKNEGDINGQLKERLKNLEKVIKAHDDINAKIKASEELGKDVKELELDIYKNLRERVKIEAQLGKIQADGQQRGVDLLSAVKEKRDSIQSSLIREKQAQGELNVLKQQLLEVENKDVELINIVQRKKEELQKTIIKENEIETQLNILRNQSLELGGKQLKKKQEEIKNSERSLEVLKNQIKLQQESFTQEENSYLSLQKYVREGEKKLSIVQGEIESKKESLSTEEAMIMALQESLELNEKTNNALKVRQAQEALIAKRMGITGNLIKGSYGLLNKLGIGSFMNLAAVTQKMQLAAQDGASRLKILGIGVKATFEAIGDALTDPTTIITGIIKGLKFIYDSAVGYQAKMFQAGKDLGLNVTESTRLFKNFQGIAASNGQLAMTARQLVATYAEVNNTLGVMGPRNAEFLTTTTGIQRRIGATAEEMQAFQFYSVATGKSLAQGYSSIIGSAKAQGARLKIAMTEKQIMESINKVSATIFNNFKGNVQKIGEAVVKATKLGLSLDQVQQAGYQLLDFESSISKEFEAQLLTGKNINLARARQLALTGSTEQLMEEITSQLGSQAEWNKMNVIQQQSLAEAMGMSKEAVDEMYKKQQLIAVLGAEAGASSKTQYDLLLKQGKTHDEISQLIGDRAASDALSASVQDKMAATMERIKDAIGEATSRFLPLIESIANFLSDTEKLKQTFSAIATIIGGIAGVSIGMSLQRKAMLATEIQSRLVTNQLLATQMMQEKSDARRLVSNRGIVLVKKAQNIESTIGLTKTQVQQVAETGLARTRIIGAAASAASFAGPLALLAGGAVLSYFMSKLAMSGVSGGGGMSGGGGGEIPTPEAGIEPVNKEAEVIKNNESRKINEGRMPDPKYYILQVDPITGNKMERQVTKEYYESQGGQFKNN
jgi:hypothetical protein